MSIEAVKTGLPSAETLLQHGVFSKISLPTGPKECKIPNSLKDMLKIHLEKFEARLQTQQKKVIKYLISTKTFSL